MPSQEENLENLMKDTQDVEMLDLNEMSEDDIDKILQANNQQVNGNKDDMSETDLLDLLSADESEAELNSIYDMLKKADNNEAIDDSIFQSEDEEFPNPLSDEIPDSQKAQKQGFFSKLKDRLSGNAGKTNKKENKKENRKKKKQDKKQEAEKDRKQEAEKDRKEEIENDLSDIVSKNLDTGSSENAGNIEDSIMQDIAGQTDELFENMAALDQGLIESLEQDAKDLENMIPDKDDVSARKEQRKEKEEKKSGKGFFQKIISILFEEDEEENDEQSALHLTEENEEILKELDNENKKNKKKPDKKKKNTSSDGEDEEQSDNGKKKKKPKKEKKTKLKPIDSDAGKKLSKKKVGLVFSFCMTLCAVILVLSFIAIDYSDKLAARKAFRKQDYDTCYQNLYGKKFLNESQQVMYGKSESILRARLWKREYEVFAQEGSELQALDCLLSAVNEYPKLISYSDRFDAGEEVNEIYKQIIGILDEKYHISEELAKEVGSEPNDVLYTKKVKELLENWSGSEETTTGNDHTIKPNSGTHEDNLSGNENGDENRSQSDASNYEIEIPITIR